MGFNPPIQTNKLTLENFSPRTQSAHGIPGRAGFCVIAKGNLFKLNSSAHILLSLPLDAPSLTAECR